MKLREARHREKEANEEREFWARERRILEAMLGKRGAEWAVSESEGEEDIAFLEERGKRKRKRGKEDEGKVIEKLRRTLKKKGSDHWNHLNQLWKQGNSKKLTEEKVKLGLGAAGDLDKDIEKDLVEWIEQNSLIDRKKMERWFKKGLGEGGREEEDKGERKMD